MNGGIVEGINNGQYPTVHCVIIISIYIVTQNINKRSEVLSRSGRQRLYGGARNTERGDTELLWIHLIKHRDDGHRYTHSQTHRLTHRLTDSQTHRLTDSQTHRLTDSQTLKH